VPADSETFDSQAALIAEQLHHAIDLLRADIDRLQRGQQHADQLADQRLMVLERQVSDFEQRIRSLQESATQFKLLSSLAVGGGLLSVINLIRLILT
jgi:hypothetical protein